MPYAVEVARDSVYRRTEGYGEGMGLDDAVAAARYVATRALASYVTWVSANPEVPRSLGGHAELEELVAEARRHLGNR